MDDEEFWNNSNIRSFSFDEDDRVSVLFQILQQVFNIICEYFVGNLTTTESEVIC